MDATTLSPNDLLIVQSEEGGTINKPGKIGLLVYHPAGHWAKWAEGEILQFVDTSLEFSSEKERDTIFDVVYKVFSRIDLEFNFEYVYGAWIAKMTNF